MNWIAPSEKDTATETLEKRLWAAADQFRANSGLKAQEYSAPVLGLIFLRFAEVRFAAQRAKLEKEREKLLKELEPLRLRLLDEGFLAKAPEAAVAKLRGQAEEKEQRLVQIQALLG